MAPGTGLGEAYLVSRGDLHIPLCSEGGHVDFSPNSEIEDGLLNFLRTRYGHVSYERVICGPGLVNIFEYLVAARQLKPAIDISKSADPAAEIMQHSSPGSCPCSEKAVEIFIDIIGAQAGNLALNFMANGGVYLAGGIPPKILSKLQDGRILKSYFAKGRLRGVVERTPLYVVRDDHTPLLGSARMALEKLGSR
jgi:glucokinase